MTIQNLTILLLAVGNLINTYRIMGLQKRLNLLEEKLDEVTK